MTPETERYIRQHGGDGRSKKKLLLVLFGLATLCKWGVVMISIELEEGSVFYVTLPMAVASLVLLAIDYDKHSAVMRQLSGTERPRPLMPALAAVVALGLAGIVGLGISKADSNNPTASPAGGASSRSSTNEIDSNVPTALAEFIEERDGRTQEILDRATDGPSCAEYLTASADAIAKLPSSCVYDTSPEEVRYKHNVSCSGGSSSGPSHTLEAEEPGMLWFRMHYEDAWVLINIEDERAEREEKCRPDGFNFALASPSLPGTKEILIAHTVQEVFAMSLETGERTRLEKATVLVDTAVAPDGSRVAVLRGVGGVNGELVVVNVDGSDRRSLLPREQGVYDIEFAQTSEAVFFVGRSNGKTQAGVADLNEDSIRVILEDLPVGARIVGPLPGGFMYSVDDSETMGVTYIAVDEQTGTQRTHLTIDERHRPVAVLTDGSALLYAADRGALWIAPFDGRLPSELVRYEWTSSRWVAESSVTDELIVAPPLGQNRHIASVGLGEGLGTSSTRSRADLGGVATSGVLAPSGALVVEVDSGKNQLVYITMNDEPINLGVTATPLAVVDSR